MHEIIPLWFIPSYYGDLKLEARDEKTCSLVTIDLTPTERTALGKFEIQAKKKKWIESNSVLGTNASNVLQAPIETAAKALAKILKPTRTIVSAVRFHDGTMEEIRSSPSSTEQPTPSEQESPESPGSGKTSRSKKKPVVATSVAAPVRGCPAPEFSKAEIRAQRVLAAFLTTEQLDDFKRHNKFISVGQVTGNRYMITSRHARDELTTYTRTLYDLDRRTPICTHDWDVPASEEMLALHIFLQLPGWEVYLNQETENLEQVLAAFDEERNRFSVSPTLARMMGLRINGRPMF